MSRNRIAKKSKTSKELIRIDFNKQTCSARDVHAFLGVKLQFTKWIKTRIEEYGFLEGKDYNSFSPTGLKVGRPRLEYNVTIGMAKELGMVERTEKGSEVRKYFLQVEEDYKSTLKYQAVNHNDPNWKPQRIESKVVRLDLTDALEKLVVYAEAQGSKSPKMFYVNYSKLINRLFEFNDYVKAQKNKRDYMSIKQLAELSNIENKLTDIIYNGMQDELYYKDIYLVCKEKIDKYIELFGTTPVIYNIPIERTEYTLLN